MRRDEVLAILAEHRDEIREMGATSVSLFGPIAHDRDDPDQEIDILVEVVRGTGLMGFAGLQLFLEEILGRDVHLVTPNAIREQEARDRILREAVRAA